MFLDFYEKGLAYRKQSTVNWDPVDKTVLANEQVIDGCGWRSGAKVEKKELEQWFLKITHYADDLLEKLDTLNKWPEKVKIMQKNWIGKSEGVLFDFNLVDEQNKAFKNKLTVFTTRADTLFGASFCAIAYDHPIAKDLAKTDDKLREFQEQCSKLGITEEELEKSEKIGVKTKLYALHPFIQEKRLPIFVANFVLMHYGTGAIFGCPAHDQRDLDFRKKIPD